METGVGQLSIRGGAREVSDSQAGKKDHEGKDNNKRRGLFRRSLRAKKKWTSLSGFIG